MGCLSSAQVTRIKAAIAKLDELIAAAEASLLTAIENSEIETYRFDSGDGSQRADRRNPQEINDLIDDLAARRDRLQRKLDGTSNVTLNWRRRSYGYGGRRYSR
jgi:hypothetical protein